MVVVVEEERVISVGFGGHHDVMRARIRDWVREVIRKLSHLCHHHVHYSMSELSILFFFSLEICRVSFL